MCLYIYISQLLVTKWLMYKETVKLSSPHISLFKSCYVLWLPAWWALWLPWWPPAGCNNALMYLLIFTMNFCYCFIVVFCWKWNLLLHTSRKQPFDNQLLFLRTSWVSRSLCTCFSTQKNDSLQSILRPGDGAWHCPSQGCSCSTAACYVLVEPQ